MGIWLQSNQVDVYIDRDDDDGDKDGDGDGRGGENGEIGQTTAASERKQDQSVT